MQILEERQVVIVGGNEDVTPVKRRWSVVRMTVERILAGIHRIAIAAGVGERLGPV
jgi:hypothetical protein